VGGMVFGATNAFNPNTGYDLISRLLAIVILGGLVTSTALSLFVLPTLALRFGRFGEETPGT